MKAAHAKGWRHGGQALLGAVCAFFFMFLILPVCGAENTLSFSTGTADFIRFEKESGMVFMRGNAKIDTASMTLTADHITVDLNAKTARAEGNVHLVDEFGTIQGTEADYGWETSSGVILNAHGFSDEWSFTSKRMVQRAPGHFLLHGGNITSCDADPPHYTFRAGEVDFKTHDRAVLTNTSLFVEDTPGFWSPYFRRSLKPRKYSLRIEPGNSARDGLILRNSLTYPFTDHSSTKFKWHWFERTGNMGGLEHRYFYPRVRGHFDTEYIRDTNPDPQPQATRYFTRWNHYQSITNRLTFNANLDFQSDQQFGNEFWSGGRYNQNEVRGLLSEAGLQYQLAKGTIETQVSRRDRYDTSQGGENFIGKLVLPRIAFTTIPMQWRYFPIYTSFSGNYTSQTSDRFSPNVSLDYQKSSDVAGQLKKDFRLRDLWTLTPRMGYAQSWYSHDFSKPDSSKDIYQGRINTGMDARRRYLRMIDLTLRYDYNWRTEINSLSLDRKANDYGIERNLGAVSLVSRVGRSTRVGLNSGVDLRSSPRNQPTKYDHFSERMLPPSADIQWEIMPKVNLYFRETYKLFDAASRTSVRTPLNTSGEIQLGDFVGAPFFSQGFSYSKNDFFPESRLYLTNRLKLYLTRKWYVDAFISYQAAGPGGLNYKKVEPIERTLRVVRDLHCWLLRMEFSSRPGQKEASFYIDLKSNISSRKNIFERDPYQVYDPTRAADLDESSIFPEEDLKPAEETDSF